MTRIVVIIATLVEEVSLLYIGDQRSEGYCIDIRGSFSSSWQWLDTRLRLTLHEPDTNSNTLTGISGVSFIPFSFIVQFLLIIFTKESFMSTLYNYKKYIYVYIYGFFSFFFSSFFPSSVDCSLLDPSATPLLFSTPLSTSLFFNWPPSARLARTYVRTLAHASRVSVYRD